MKKHEDSPREIVNQLMNRDRFSQWLGIRVLDISLGSCTCSMTVRKDMLNGFGILHGGVVFAMADSVLAFASNSRGKLSLALKVSISFLRRVGVGEILMATANEEYLGDKTGLYRIYIVNEKQEKVAVFDGTVYRTNRKSGEIKEE